VGDASFFGWNTGDGAGQPVCKKDKIFIIYVSHFNIIPPFNISIVIIYQNHNA
jgi:hypothetical protein